MRIKFLDNPNRDIKHAIKPVEDKTSSPSTSAKGKKKHVSFIEQANNVVVGSSQP